MKTKIKPAKFTTIQVSFEFVTPDKPTRSILEWHKGVIIHRLAPSQPDLVKKLKLRIKPKKITFGSKAPTGQENHQR